MDISPRHAVALCTLLVAFLPGTAAGQGLSGSLSGSVHLQHFSGKPWAASAQISLGAQGIQRILLEQRGTRRLSSQSILDLRVSKKLSLGDNGSLELLLDVLNLLDETAEEALVSDVLAATTFGQPRSFVDPRRAMIGARLHFGR